MQLTITTKKPISSISILLLSVLIFLFQFPLIGDEIVNPIYLGLFCMYLASIINRLGNAKNIELITIVGIAIYICIELVYNFAGLSDASLTSYFQTMKYFWCMIMILPVQAYLTRKQEKILLTVSISAMLLAVLYNVYVYVRMGSAYNVRLFASQDVMGVLDTQYISGVMLFCGFCFICWYHEKNKQYKRLLMAMLIFCVAFEVIIAQRGIILCMLILMFPVLFYFGQEKKNSRLILLMVALAACVVVLVLYRPILLWLMEVCGSERLADRIGQVLILLETGSTDDAGGSLSARYDLIMTSLRTFTDSPVQFILGAGDHRENNLIIGNHSRFIDTLGRYGLIGAVVLFTVMTLMLRRLKAMSSVRKNTVLYYQFTVVVIFFLFRGLLGEVFDPSIGVQMFIVAPLLMKRYSREVYIV